MTGKTKKLLLNASLAFLSLAFVLVLAEAALRAKYYYEDKRSLKALSEPIPSDGRVGLAHLIEFIDDDRIIYEMKPGLSVMFEGEPSVYVPVETDGEGFRGKGRAVAKPDKTVRIVGLGDSIMFGWGVSQGKDFLSVLEDRLNAKHPDYKWEAFNTAVPGYNTAMEVEALKKKALKYKPDIVVVSFVVNDLSLPNFITIRENYLTLRKSFIYEFITDRVKRINTEKIRGLSVKSTDLLKKNNINSVEMEFVDEKNPRILAVDSPKTNTGEIYEYQPSRVPEQYRGMVGWDAFDKAMEELRRLSKKGHFEVMVVNFDQPRTGKEAELSATAMKKSKDMGFHVIDLWPLLSGYMRDNGIASWGGSVLSLPKDSHPSAFAHEMAADEISRYLESHAVVKDMNK